MLPCQEKDVALLISRVKLEELEERLRLLRSSLNKDRIRRVSSQSCSQSSQVVAVG